MENNAQEPPYANYQKIITYYPPPPTDEPLQYRLTEKKVEGIVADTAEIKCYQQQYTYLGGYQITTEKPIKHGAGSLWYKGEDVKYKGFWENDRRHGVGTLTDSNGIKFKGDWINGELPEDSEITITYPDQQILVTHASKTLKTLSDLMEEFDEAQNSLPDHEEAAPSWMSF